MSAIYNYIDFLGEFVLYIFKRMQSVTVFIHQLTSHTTGNFFLVIQFTLNA